MIAGFVCYYLSVAFKQDSAAQSPERLYRERGLMAYLVLCLLVFFGLMFVNIPVLYDLFKVMQSPVSPLWRMRPRAYRNDHVSRSRGPRSASLNARAEDGTTCVAAGCLAVAVLAGTRRSRLEKALFVSAAFCLW